MKRRIDDEQVKKGTLMMLQPTGIFRNNTAGKKADEVSRVSRVVLEICTSGHDCGSKKVGN